VRVNSSSCTRLAANLNISPLCMVGSHILLERR
jgi:hypothetical protein